LLENDGEREVSQASHASLSTLEESDERGQLGERYVPPYRAYREAAGPPRERSHQAVEARSASSAARRYNNGAEEAGPEVSLLTQSNLASHNARQPK
jgi:hypothetical protein